MASVLTRVLPLLLAAALVAAPVLAQRATWYEAYAEAEAALAREDWSEAVRHLKTALELKSDSGANVRTYGMRFVAYFPFLELGSAYYHLGQTEAALSAFETELSQGAIRDSPRHLAQLEGWRERIDRERTEAEASRRARAASLLTTELETSARLEREGRLDDALTALTRALAVAPSDPTALSVERRLRAALAERRRVADEGQRFEGLLAAGRRHQAAGRLREAAARFDEAVAIRPASEARDLLARVQAALRAEVERRSESERGTLLATSLDRARELAGRGSVDDALAEIQTLLALAPGHPEALALHDRLIAEQAAAEVSERADAEVETLLEEARRLTTQGDDEGALRSANRALAIEPGNSAALALVAAGYGRLSSALLESDTAPPVVLIDDRSLTPAREGEPIRIRQADLLLTGSAYDGSPVEVTIALDGVAVGPATVDRREFNGVWITDFRIEQLVPAGVSVLEVSATDRQGNRAAAEYRVEYVVPFVRSRWLPVALVALVLTALAAYLLVGHRRRRKMLRDRFNPYVAGAPILDQSRFFGRQQLLEYVLRRVCNNSVMLYGERRIGKTSFQHRLKTCLASLQDPVHEFFPVFVDLQGISEERFFGTLASEVFHELAPKLGGLEPEARVADETYGYREFVRDVQRVLAALAERSAKKVKLVLLIDEVDELNHYDPRINQRLRSLFMRAFSDRLAAVVSGVAIKKEWEREGSPWYNFFQEIEVKPLDSEEARALIEGPVRGVFTFERGASDEIIRRTRSKPYLIQRLCTGLIDRMHEERRAAITLADVEAACAGEGL